MKKRIRDYGIRIGDHPAGALNKLTDVQEYGWVTIRWTQRNIKRG